jgi:predicted dehydrogenase
MDVINHPDVEAVWICSPSQFHAEQILACADAGKHIFCEKPLATDLKETLDAVNYCRTKGVKLMTALQRRFDPNFVRCKEAVVNGEIGKPIVIKLCSRDPAPAPRSYVEVGGGIFKDMAVHDLVWHVSSWAENPSAFPQPDRAMLTPRS